jgi:competence protein ComEC
MKQKIILLSLGILVQVVVRIYSPGVSTACTFTVFDVGQGDAILIRTADNQDILIDGGPDDKVVDRLSQALPAGDREIELMVLTHPHSDHVNGLVPVTERFIVRRVLETGLPIKESAYDIWHAMLKEKNIPIDYARAGQRYNVGVATFDVLWPALDLSKKDIVGDNAAEGGGINDSSIVMRLTCGGSAAMLTGDASSDIEERILDGGAIVQSKLLKVGHHGSRFSSDANFLKAVRATWAVISVGAGNGYKHPHPTALLRLTQAGLQILRTDKQGDIRLHVDGRGGWENSP